MIAASEPMGGLPDRGDAPVTNPMAVLRLSLDQGMDGHAYG
jgi:hypothetical protein